VERLALRHAPLLDGAVARAAAVETLSSVRPAAASLEALARLLGPAGLRATFREDTLEALAGGAAGTAAVVAAGGGLWWVTGEGNGRVGVQPLGTDAGARKLGAADAAGVLGVKPHDALRLLDAVPLHPASGEQHADTPLGAMWALLRVESSDLWVVVIYAMGYGLLSLATPVAVQSLVNTVAFGSLMQPILVLTLLVAVALGLGALLRSLQAWVVEQVQQRLMVRVALELGQRLPRVREEELTGGAGQEMLNRFFDVLTLQKSVSTFLMEGILLVLQASMGLLLLAFYHPALLAFDVVLVGLALAVLVLAGRHGTSSAIQESREKYALAAWLEELARVPVVLRGPEGASWAQFQVEERVRAWLSARKAHHRVSFRQLAGAYALQAVAATALLGLGGWLVIERQLTLGQLVAAEFVVTTVLSSVTRLGKQLETWYDALAAADKLSHLLHLPTEAESGAGLSLAGEGPLRVTLVHGLELRAGERVAVVGPAGAGKSWLGRALWGLEMPEPGRLSLGGVDLVHVDRAALRRAVALVRGAECLQATVADNVAVGRPGVDRAEVMALLQRVGLDGPVQELEGGDLHVLSGTGAPLTRGQARRLMFARALAGGPRLMVVDDGLEDVEPELRGMLAEVLAPDGGAPWTLLVFAQEEDALVRRCDRVVRWDGRDHGRED
jgi:ABC-type bacteriocin/lantibiotic exporter with double-glycine peptidase domain